MEENKIWNEAINAAAYKLEYGIDFYNLRLQGYDKIEYAWYQFRAKKNLREAIAEIEEQIRLMRSLRSNILSLLRNEQ